MPPPRRLRATPTRTGCRPGTPDGRSGRRGVTAAAPSGLVVIDKPAGLTSHDVVARVRRLVATRKVGHAGTLDPMATGVLVVGVGRATAAGSSRSRREELRGHDPARCEHRDRRRRRRRRRRRGRIGRDTSCPGCGGRRADRHDPPGAERRLRCEGRRRPVLRPGPLRRAGRAQGQGGDRRAAGDHADAAGRSLPRRRCRGRLLLGHVHPRSRPRPRRRAECGRPSLGTAADQGRTVRPRFRPDARPARPGAGTHAARRRRGGSVPPLGRRCGDRRSGGTWRAAAQNRHRSGPVAVFGPDGTLLSLVQDRGPRAKHLVVFVDPAELATAGPGEQ